MVHHTELGCSSSIRGYAGPVIRPSLVFIRAQADHGFDGETDASFGRPHGLVFRVMRDAGCRVEELVDAVPAVCLDHAASPTCRVLFYDVAGIPEKHAGLDDGYRLVEALPRRFHDPDRIRIGSGPVPNIVGLVQVAMEALMVQRDINVENVAIHKYPLIRDTMTDDFVG